MADKSIKCKECSSTFVFTEREQAFYKEKGFSNDPQRCPSCRSGGRQQRSGGSSGGQREMFDAVCSECGKATTVPFKPNMEKPVYCKDCYQKRNR